MYKQSITLQEVTDYLKSLAYVDSDAIGKLLRHKFQCNTELSQHSTTPKQDFSISDILAGLFGTNRDNYALIGEIWGDGGFVSFRNEAEYSRREERLQREWCEKEGVDWKDYYCERIPMYKESITLQEVTDYLYSLANADRDAIGEMLSQEFPCNYALSQHPAIFKRQKGKQRITLSDIIAGLFGTDEDNYALISEFWDESGFCSFRNEVEEARRVERVQREMCEEDGSDWEFYYG